MNESKFQSIVGDQGRFFTVVFEKKDHSLRKLTARLKVKKYVKGTGTRAKIKDLITCFEPSVGKGAECYRSFYSNKIIELHANHKVYDGEGNELKTA